MTITAILHDHSIHADILKASPPISVATLTLFGYNLSNVALIITIVYTLCLFFVLIRDKFVGHYRRSSDRRQSNDQNDDIDD